jgi:membrane associated rhomboid family serine protease
MGIYDRDYYRGSKGWFFDSLQGTGKVCIWLIILNGIAFFIQCLSPATDPGLPPGSLGAFTDLFDLNVNEVVHGQVWRLLTYSFLHAGLWHIVFNMLFLWWFGSELESIYGPREFLTFYLFSALVGGIAYTACGYYSYRAFGDAGPPCIGASGAVTAVMVVYACHFPTRLIYVFFILPVPIWLLVVFQVCQDLMTFVGRTQTGVAVTVHLGGALIGFLYYRLSWRLYPLISSFRLPRARLRRPRARLRVYREDEPPREAVRVAPAARSDTDEQLEAKLDAILEKIKTSGQESLSESERQLLLRASEVYKQRRTPN